MKTDAEKAFFLEHGYLHVQGVLDQGTGRFLPHGIRPRMGAGGPQGSTSTSCSSTSRSST